MGGGRVTRFGFNKKILSILADIFWLRFYDDIATLRLIPSFDGVHQCSF